MSSKQQKLLNCDSLFTTLNNIELEPIQVHGVIRALLEKRVILRYDTGLGKTIMMSVILRGLINAEPNKKRIVFVMKDQETETPKKMAPIVQAPIIFTSAENHKLQQMYKFWDRTSVILLTYQCLQNIELVSFLYTKLNEIDAIFIDEAHLVSNWTEANTSFMLRSIVDKVEYCIGLTATPIIRDTHQFSRLRNLINRDISYKYDENVATPSPHKSFININRQDFGLKGNYKSIPIFVTPMLHQLGKLKGNIFDITKGEGAINQVTKLLQLLQERSGKKVLVYIRYHKTRLWVEKYLHNNNISFQSIHGKVTNTGDRKLILNKFNTGEVPILLTSLTTSLDIDADTVIMYEFTTYVKQMIGRAHRGLVPKDLEIIFILTRDTVELDYFMRYIYYRSELIQDTLGIDYSEFIELGKKIEKEMLESDMVISI